MRYSKRNTSGSEKRTLSWWEKRSYGSGTQSFPKSCEYFNSKQFVGLSLHELAVLECLTFMAWKDNSWIVREASAPKISEGLSYRLKVPAIRRHLLKLVAAGYLQIKKQDYDKGHHYLVASCLLRLAHAETMAHFIEAMLLWKSAQSRMPDQNDHAQAIDADMPDQNDRTERSKRSGAADPASLTRDQNDHQDLDSIPVLGVASRHSPNSSQGGDERTTSKKVSSGRDQRGTRTPTADEIQNRIAHLKGQLDALGEKAVGKGGECNLQAEV